MVDVIELIALIFASLIILKAIFFFSFTDKQIKRYVDIVVKYHWGWFILVLFVGFLSGYFVFLEISFVEIAAVAMVYSFIMALTLLTFPSALKQYTKDLLKNRAAVAQSFIVWYLFAVIVFYVVFSS